MSKSKSIPDVLKEYLSELEDVYHWVVMSPLLVKIESFINATFDSKYSEVMEGLNSYQKSENNKAGYLGFLEGLIAKIEDQSFEKIFPMKKMPQTKN